MAANASAAALTPTAAPYAQHQRVGARNAGRGLCDYWGGEPAPASFNRHATAHTVSQRQFTRSNSLAGLMITIGYACELVAAKRLRRGDMTPPWPPRTDLAEAAV